MIEMLIAHLLGDWIFQPRRMAIQKGKQTRGGYVWCTAHVLIYTTCFFACVPGQSILFYASVFFPHFIIDKWSLMAIFQKARDGRYWYDVYKPATDESSGGFRPDTFMERVDMGLSGLKYAVEDNTAHLVCLYLSWHYLAI